MVEFDAFDPSLFGDWTERVAYDAAGAQTAAVLLETKSADAPPGDDLRQLLNEMTREMRDQFDYFRELRRAADTVSEAESDEAQAKIARADVKAATDAMSLIVRTLEKVDALQRQLARDRDLDAERNAGTESHEDAKAKFLQLIDDKAVLLFEQWKRDSVAPDIGSVGSSGAGPPGKSQGAAHRGVG